MLQTVLSRNTKTITGVLDKRQLIVPALSRVWHSLPLTIWPLAGLKSVLCKSHAS